MFQQTMQGLNTGSSLLFPQINILLSIQPKLLDLCLSEVSFFIVRFVLHLLEV